MSDYDILFIISRMGKAIISGVTDRGKRWVHSNMTEDSPCEVDEEGLDEVENLITKDGLTVRRK